MIFIAPLLIALICGLFISMLTLWFSKKGFSLLVKMTPGIITILIAIMLFYIGFVNVRGFEGASYGILSFFLILFATGSFVIVKKNAVNAKLK